MRLAGQAKGGFYPAHPEAIKLIAEQVKPPPLGKRFTILDPCMGKGAALKQWAEHLACPMEDVYGVELSESRAAEAKALLPDAKLLAPASFFGIAASFKAVSFAWVNPPFDDEIGGGERVESMFLHRATQLLVPGGVLCLVCPEHVAKKDEVLDLLYAQYEKLKLVRFPEDFRPFGEVAILGVRRKEPSTERDFNREDDYVYQVPGGRVLQRWCKTDLTEDEYDQALAASPLRRHLLPPADIKKPEPPLPLRKGHVAMLLSAGHLDGLVRPEGEPAHVVRGTARKVEYVSGQTVNESDDGKRTSVTTIINEKIQLVVRVITAEGELKTFGCDSPTPEAEDENHDE